LEYYRGNKKQTTTAIIGKPIRPALEGAKLHPALKGTILSVPQKNQVEGVLFDKIEQRSYAWKVGLRPGDIIVSANRYRIHNLDELAQVVNPNGGLVINIQRGEEGFFVVLK
jgi:S1-C subfamily serine protease